MQHTVTKKEVAPRQDSLFLKLPEIQLTEPQKEFLVEINQLTDLRVAAMKPYLFRMADKVLGIHQAEPITGILVDDASGRFVGRFIEEILRSQGVENTVYAKSNQKYDEARERAKIHAYKSLGEHPLYVTELINTGSDAMGVVRTFAEINVSPSVVTLAHQQEYINTFSAIRKRGARRVFLADVAGALCFYVSYSKALNGVRSFASDSNAQILSAASGQSGELDPRIVRQKAINHSREKLKELVSDYFNPNREKQNYGFLWSLRERFKVARKLMKPGSLSPNRTSPFEVHARWG